MNDENTRLFISMDLPTEAVNYIAEIQAKIKAMGLFEGKFIESSQLHLTLKFLGNVDKDKVSFIKTQLAKINMPFFKVKLGHLDIIPFYILYIHVKSKKIFTLQEKVDFLLSDLFDLNNRFLSHVTIARIKYFLNKRLFLEYIKNFSIKDFSFFIKEFSLKKSILSKSGAKYITLNRYYLNN